MELEMNLKGDTTMVTVLESGYVLMRGAVAMRGGRL